MDYQISSMSMMMMSVSLVAAIVIPVVLFLVLRFKFRAKAVPFFVGCATFFLFVGVLEQIMHLLVLQVSPAGKTIMDNIWLYALYGSLAAGIFEETGRFVSMKFVLKKYHNEDINGVMYGAGHGGFEVIWVLGLGMISNLALAFTINSGMLEAQLSLLPEDAKSQLIATVEALCEINPWIFGVGIVERLIAVAIHISLSVLVWIAVTRGGRCFVFYPIAILLHFLFDAIAVLVNNYFGALPTEIGLFVFVLACIYAVYRIYQKVKKEESKNIA